jgi:Fic family protein
MFIEKRKRGKVIKYYAVHSFREGKELIKIRKYLGQNLSPSELYEREKKAWIAIQEQLRQYREIRDPLKYVLSQQELQQLKALEERSAFKVFHLSEDQWRRFSELFSYNTNAIEGSTLTLREVTSIIEHKKKPQKPTEDIEEAQGVVEAINYIRKTKESLSLGLIAKLHKIVFKHTKSFAGQFRQPGIEVVIRDGVGNIVHRGAPSNKVNILIQELVEWYEANKKKYSGILLAAVVHNQFENIHPFQDGNGRVGRLLMNFVLLKHKLPPVNIELNKRQQYYEALQEYQNYGNIRPMIELMLKEYQQLKKQLR